ncbi:MAG: acyl-CoA reductase [Oscillospiraceae bacterium]|nr:acyl-CoA reductase [Oscillospiraceae bacterium]
MIIANGKIYRSEEQDRILAAAAHNIDRTLAERSLDAETVIAAIDRLGSEIARGVFDERINELPVDEPMRYKAMAAEMLSREFLEYKLAVELGGSEPENAPENAAFTRIMPLGVIFHIAAGNMDGLPAFSLAEGLLTGNINILKLPRADNGLSVEIIAKLIEYEPRLADFIYVFDTPSSDVHAMKKMAALADGIAVWGGDGAVSAVRALAPVGTRLIEWGHKLSFAYISGYEDKERELTELAAHIAATKQLLCSSCQVIYLDTDDESELEGFCAEFLPILEREIARRKPVSIGGRAHSSLLRYTDMLEDILGEKPLPKHFGGKGCSLTIGADSELELSDMMCNVLVKKLPRRGIVPVLRRGKNYLQTAGLICPESERAELADIFARCGVTRVTSAGAMSDYFAGEGHDGDYPLRRYTRVVNTSFDWRR